MTLKLSLPPDLETRLKAAAARNGQPADQYAVHVLDQQDLGHQALGLRRATLVATSSRTSASSSARPWAPFWRIFWT